MDRADELINRVNIHKVDGSGWGSPKTGKSPSKPRSDLSMRSIRYPEYVEKLPYLDYKSNHL